MVAAVADTHAALWFLFGDPRLSPAARIAIETAAANRRKVAIAPVTLAEIVYLCEKNRITPTAFEDLKAALQNPNHVFEEAPFTMAVVKAMRAVPRDDVPDMPDRIVAATGVHLGVPVISRDGRIRAANIETLW